MTVALDSIPSFTPTQAVAFAERDFGIVGSAVVLPSERDQNFLLRDTSGKKFVLKIANTDDDANLLDFQNQAMARIDSTLPECRVPQALPARSGAYLSTIWQGETGIAHHLRVLSWVDGDLLAHVTYRDAGLCESIGANIAKIDGVLRGFEHPAMRRSLQWDIRHADAAREHLGLLSMTQRGRVEDIFTQWQRIDWGALTHGVIHGDANDYNVLVGDGRMIGLLDFGDMTYSARVCDLAIALAYAMLDEADPLAAASHLVRGYHRHYALDDVEQRAIPTLTLSRLAMSVCYAAHNRARNPVDPYQVVTEAAAWKLIARLQSLPASEMQALIRHAAQ